MEFLPPVIFEVKASATQAIAEFKMVNHELAKMELSSVKAGAGIRTLTAASKYAGVALLGMAGIAGVVGVAGVKAAMEQQDAQALLQKAIENTGVSFADALPAINAHGKSMIALGFADEQMYEALTKMTAASGSPKLALDSLGVAADLARYKHISLAEAGTLVARASIGQAKGLGDLGIAIGKTIPKGASLAQIFKAIEDRAGGSAQAFAGTFSGKLAIANANFDQLKETIGFSLLPVLNDFILWFTKEGIPKLTSFFEFLKKNKTVVLEFAAALASIFVVSKITAGVTATVTAIQTLIKMYNLLKISAVAAAIAEAFATGGVSLGVAGAALAAVGLVGGATLLSVLANKTTNAPNAPYNFRAAEASTLPALPTKKVDLTGRPIKPITKSIATGNMTSGSVNNINTIINAQTNASAGQIAQSAAQAIKTGVTFHFKDK